MDRRVTLLIAAGALILFVGTAAASGDGSSTNFDVVTFLEDIIAFFESLLEVATADSTS